MAPLSSRPNLENLKNRAKSLLKDHARGEPVVCHLLRRLSRFSDASNEVILSAKVTLGDIQAALAIENGFATWPDLKRAIESGRTEATSSPQSMPLTLDGDGHQQDSFSLVLTAVANALGRSANDEDVFVRSTNAFSLAIIPGEGNECPAWWHMAGREHGLDILRRSLGLKIERLDLPPVPDPVWHDPELQAQRREQLAPRIQHALEAGGYLITSGGWDWKWQMPHATPHCWWGVILEVQKNAMIRGACLNGRTDNPIAILTDECWTVSLADPTLNDLEADQAMLALALSRIRADAAPFLPPPTPWRPVFGLAAIDVWINQFCRVPFCPDCGDRSFRCAHATALTLAAGSQTAATYLHRHANRYPPKAAQTIAKAAACYTNIHELLTPFLARDAAQGYQAVMGDSNRQAWHIEKVLLPVRSAMDSAANAIADTLAAW
ncbi:MAG: hypothetical protein FWD61_06615 [Phycisphaerales bacterium]|nr:hypothetical protein [Phycisphaerales bacterium]